MATYSFLDVNCLVVGPGLVANLAAGAAAAEEGITIEASEDKNEMTIGADGKGMHSLIASDAAHVTIRLLKTAPGNAILMAAYDAQSISSALWGQNIITVTNTAVGDISVLQACAFKKKPTINYKKVGDMYEWTFDAIQANTVLGLSAIL